MIATLERKPLGQLLLAKGLIQQEQLERALEEQKRSGHQKLLGEVLVELRICTEDQITEALAQAYCVPYARVSPKIADPEGHPGSAQGISGEASGAAALSGRRAF